MSALSSWFRALLAAPIVLAAACGAPPPPVAAPTLPGDGTEHVAKPPTTEPDPNDWKPLGELIVPPTLATAAPLKLPPVQRFTLSNGLAVLLVPSTTTPTSAFQLVIRGGSRAEPKSRLGVAELTANLLVKGSARRNAAGLERAIEGIAGTIAVDATYEATFASCAALAREADTCVTLLAEMVSAPLFPAKDFESTREALLRAVRGRAKNPRSVANAHLQQLLWGDGHVRGWVESEETISSITRADVVAWHRAWYAPNNAMLVIVGDLNAAKLKPRLERAFAPWRKRAVAPTPTYPEAMLPAVRVRLVDSPGATQTQIRVGLRGITHDDPRFFESLVWNHALGGTGGARLSRALRERGAANLSAESTFDRNADRGSIAISSAARSSEAVAVTQVLLGEMARMTKDGPTAAEVTAALAVIEGAYLARAETASDLAASFATAELHGFGEQYVQNFPVRLQQVTPESAKDAAALLDLERSVVVLVGDAKDLEPQLNKAGWKFEKVKITDGVSGAVAVSTADPAQVAAARKVLDAAIKAKGGEAKLRAVKSLQFSGKGSSTVEGNTITVVTHRWYQLPDRLRVDFETTPAGDQPQASIQIGVDGAVGWQRSPEGLQDIPSEDLASVAFERWREPELVLLEARAPQVTLRPAPDLDIDGKAHTALTISTPFGIDLVLAFDPQTMLLRRMSYTIAGEQNVDDFTAYRDVAGLKIAHQRVSTAGGRITTLELDKVQVNPKIDPAIFKKPAP